MTNAIHLSNRCPACARPFPEWMVNRESLLAGDKIDQTPSVVIEDCCCIPAKARCNEPGAWVGVYLSIVIQTI